MEVCSTKFFLHLFRVIGAFYHIPVKCIKVWDIEINVSATFPLGRTSIREAFRKKNRKIYDDLLKGGWVANSKHDFFSIKNYDIIIGRVGDRLPCHNFQIIIFS